MVQMKFWSHIDNDEILEHMDNDVLVEWIAFDMDASDFLHKLPGTEIIEYLLENRIIAPAVTDLSNKVSRIKGPASSSDEGQYVGTD